MKKKLVFFLMLFILTTGIVQPNIAAAEDEAPKPTNIEINE